MLNYLVDDPCTGRRGQLTQLIESVGPNQYCTLHCSLASGVAGNVGIRGRHPEVSRSRILGASLDLPHFPPTLHYVRCVGAVSGRGRGEGGRVEHTFAVSTRES